MAEKLWVALLSVVVGIGVLGGAVWLIVVGEVAGVERIFVILVAAILALVAWFCLRLELRGPEDAAAARAARPASTQNPTTGSQVPASS